MLDLDPSADRFRRNNATTVSWYIRRRRAICSRTVLLQDGFAQQQQSGSVYGQGAAVNRKCPVIRRTPTARTAPCRTEPIRRGIAPYQPYAPSQDMPAANFQDQHTATIFSPPIVRAPTFNIPGPATRHRSLVLVNFFIDHQVTLDGAVRGPGTYFVGPNVVLQDLVQSAGGTVNWADENGVELVSTVVDSAGGRAETRRAKLPLHKGMFASYIVQPHDEFRFASVFTNTGLGSVTVQGEVHSPGTYRVMRGEHLSELLARAGGLTSVAYPYGTVFLRKSAADAERNSYVRTANQVEDELVVAMTRVGSDKISPDTFSAMQSFVNDLRNQKALGRISIQG